MVQTYKCPGCGASLQFTPGAGELVCEYCGTHVSVEQLEQDQAPADYKVENQVDHSKEAHGDMNSYVCKNCGAHLIVEKHTSATTCAYCGSPAVIEERLEGVLKPAGVIPFKINKEQAKEMFRKWICTGFFTPSVFKKQASIEQIKGIYVPFWLYDYEAEADAAADCTRVSTERRGDYRYTHTDHYHVERRVRSQYEKIPADASEKMPDDVMDRMEPYNYGEIVDFSMPYLSGYESEKYNYESNDVSMVKRIEDRVNSYIYRDLQSTVNGYTGVTYLRKDISLRRKQAKYTLFPVWILTYRYLNQNFMFAINGQTGKQVGKLPNSKGKIWGSIAGITFGICFALLMLGGLLG